MTMLCHLDIICVKCELNNCHCYCSKYTYTNDSMFSTDYIKMILRIFDFCKSWQFLIVMKNCPFGFFQSLPWFLVLLFAFIWVVLFHINNLTFDQNLPKIQRNNINLFFSLFNNKILPHSCFSQLIKICSKKVTSSGTQHYDHRIKSQILSLLS